MKKVNSPKVSGMQSNCAFLFLFLLLVTCKISAGEWSTEEFLVGLERVHIYKPVSDPVLNGKRALMISLHGCAMSSDDMRDHAGWEQAADKFGMVVATPDVPEGGYFNTDCWNYYGQNHSRSNKYNDEIIALAHELVARDTLNIDPDQVYITGFSSGGSQANVIACLAPDIFAGVGSVSGPGLGTSHTEFNLLPISYSVENAADLCLHLAGEATGFFETQIYSTLHGLSDDVVAPEYNDTGSDLMARVYRSKNKSEPSSLSKDATLILTADSTGPRVSKITVAELGHDWPSSAGSNLDYFVNTKIDYPKYVTQWFFENNRRVNREGK
jgi:poly(3-hydroxybutyrate) depolymerase